MRTHCVLNAALRGILAVASVSASLMSFAQNFPMYGGNAQRTGANTAPTTTGPGRGDLIWFKQAVSAPGTSPFLRHVMSPEATVSSGWMTFGTANRTNESVNVFRPLPTGNATEDTFSGYSAWATAETGGTAVDYYASYSIASSRNAQNNKLTPSDSLNSITFKIEPAASADRVKTNFKLYFRKPDSSSTIAGASVFTQRYYVVDVGYGAGASSHKVFVVDTFNMDLNNLVQIGTSGISGAGSFPYDGTTPITVTFYNTVPRDAVGNLTEPWVPGSGGQQIISPQKLVYVDQVEAVPDTFQNSDLSSYAASPIVSAADPGSGLGTTQWVLRCENKNVSTGGTSLPRIIGTVYKENPLTGTLQWQWSPVETSPKVNYYDTNSTIASASTGWTTSNTSVGQQPTAASNYLTAPVSTTANGVAQTSVTFDPQSNILDGSYLIQVWIPGNGGGLTFGQAMTYLIHEGSGSTSTVVLDQSTSQGWVTLGSRSFAHDRKNSRPLSVEITNASTQTGDTGKTAFANAVRFVGTSGLGINSTPVETTALVRTTVSGTPANTAVIIVAGEDGRIYCLDAAGDGHGSTTVLWAYPSLSGTTDPNQVAGLDGPGPTASMPTQFQTSSALVQRISGNDYLYIGAANGRVYCIDMAGRGDGTTNRVWTFPDDYPATRVESSLGPIAGSVVYANPPSGPTIYIPASQGRIYAVSALGNANRTTNLKWAFPSGSSQRSGFTSFASAARATGDSTWTNPTSANVFDHAYASSTPDKRAPGTGNTEYLLATNPAAGQLVPAGKNVLGFQVRVVRHRTAGDAALTIKDSDVKLVKGGTIQATNRADTTTDWGTDVQVIQMSGGATSGTFTLTYGGQTTTAIPYNAAPADVQSALNALSSTTGTPAVCSGTNLPTGKILVTFVATPYANAISADSTGLAGTPTPQVIISRAPDGEAFYGGQSDKWGTTWTPAETGAGFGVAIAAHGTGDSTTNTVLPQALIDYVEVRAFYAGDLPLAPIKATPVVRFNSIYFGTLADTQNENPGQFYSLDWDSGVKNWVFDGSVDWGGTFSRADSFSSGAATASATELTSIFSNGATQHDSVFVANDNGWISAIDAQTGPTGGTGVERVVWATKELSSPVVSSLGFARMNVLDSNSSYTDGSGNPNNAPVVLVPTASGAFDALFALAPRFDGSGNLIKPDFGATNKRGGRRAWEYVLPAGTQINTAMAVGENTMFGADNQGHFLAFGNNNSGSTISGPGTQTQVENDSGYNGYADDFRQAKIKAVTRAAYHELRAGTLTYAQATDSTREDPRWTQSAGKNGPYDWGETIYFLVYNFPKLPAASVSEPSVSFLLSGAGVGMRTSVLAAQQFVSPTTSPQSDTGDNVYLDGYAIYPFTLQGGGSAVLVPGPITLTVSINTTATTNPPREVAISSPDMKVTFWVANPLAIYIPVGGSVNPAYSIGYSTDPANAQNLVNGSPVVSGHEDHLTALLGTVTPGQTGSVTIGVVDRSLITLLHGPGRGLDNVKVDRSDLAWNTGSDPLAVANPLPVGVFPGFEDLPIENPNISLDYPNIRRDRVSAVKDPTGSPENPVDFATSLFPPTGVNELDPKTRTLVTTPFRFDVSVPQYQPPNVAAGATIDSAGNPISPGYLGRFRVFVDNSVDGRFSSDINHRVAYRSFILANDVPVTEKFYSATPVVDLGSLSQGSGMATDPTKFSPWNGVWDDLFKPVNVTSVSNVNLLNMRLAKGYGQSGSVTDWAILPKGNSPFAWLDASTNVVSDIDYTSFDAQSNRGMDFLSASGQSILQKPRVGDRAGTVLSTNPIRRSNANLKVPTGPLRVGPNAPTPGPARIAATIPFGFPVGTYSEIMRIINDGGTQNVLDTDASNNPIDTFTDPGFTLRFTVHEGRLTGKNNVDTPPLVDDPSTTNPANSNVLYANGQPAALRDTNGNVVLVFPSDRPSFNATVPTSPQGAGTTMLYGASLHGGTPGATQNPLNDLNSFLAASSGGTWFSKDLGPYPTTPASQLFIDTSLSSYNINPNTPVRFSQPAFAASIYNPLDGTANANPYLVFVGEAQVQNAASNSATNSRVFISKGTIANNGQISLADPVVLPDASNRTNANAVITGTIKQRPTLVQLGPNATVFYSSSGSGQGAMYMATFNGTQWTSNYQLGLPLGFSEVGSPSASARTYTGATLTNAPNGAGTTVLSNGENLIELTFPGKLAGRSHSDIFFGRMKVNASGIPLALSNDPTDVFIDLAPVVGEILKAQQPGIYQATGVAWDRTSPLGLFVNGTDLLSGSTRQVDQATGIISADNPQTGGRVYLDPASGSIRFSGNIPGPSAVIQLSYTPKFARISSGGTTTTHPTLLFDNHPINDYAGWYTTAGVPITTGSLKDDRYFVTYGGLSIGSGAASRPYLTTYRFGVQLPTPVAVNSNGQPISLSMSGSGINAYQLDAVRGRLYFQSADEAKSVSATYTGVNPDGSQSAQAFTGSVGLVPENDESPIQMEGAVNESQLTSFLDPFSSAIRPGLVWMFWTSTRGGTPDLFFQTISPNFSPARRIQ